MAKNAVYIDGLDGVALLKDSDETILKVNELLSIINTRYGKAEKPSHFVLKDNSLEFCLDVLIPWKEL